MGHFKLINHRSIRIPCLHAKERPTRDILHVTGVTLNLDTLHVFVVHPFKVGRTKGFRTKAITSSSNHQKMQLIVCFKHLRIRKLLSWAISMIIRITNQSPWYLVQHAPIPPLKTNKLYNLLASQSKQRCRIL